METKKIDWKSKLSSRKFWVSIVGILVALITTIFADELSPEQVKLISTGLYTLVAFIFGESAVDVASRWKANG